MQSKEIDRNSYKCIVKSKINILDKKDDYAGFDE